MSEEIEDNHTMLVVTVEARGHKLSIHGMHQIQPKDKKNANLKGKRKEYLSSSGLNLWLCLCFSQKIILRSSMFWMCNKEIYPF